MQVRVPLADAAGLIAKLCGASPLCWADLVAIYPTPDGATAGADPHERCEPPPESPDMHMRGLTLFDFSSLDIQQRMWCVAHGVEPRARLR